MIDRPRSRARTWLSTLGRLRRREAVAWRWVFGIGAAALVVWTTFFASRARRGPESCGAGLVPQGSRCCPAGQLLKNGQCRGQPRRCPPGLQLATQPQLGCVAILEPARFAGGKLRLAPNDWESEGVITPRILQVGGFKLDRTEVTNDAWRRCQAAGSCEPLLAKDPPVEPGVPVTGVTFAQAESFCAFVGGRLPTYDELVYAAAGTEMRRFPWGPHGLVCRRAAFGLEQGPCGEGAKGPELAGSRPDGATPQGVLDLAGNVAEWCRAPDGSARLFGGSYRAKAASQLKSWSSEPPRVDSDVGFRCAYDLGHGR